MANSDEDGVHRRSFQQWNESMALREIFVEDNSFLAGIDYDISKAFDPKAQDHVGKRIGMAKEYKLSRDGWKAWA